MRKRDEDQAEYSAKVIDDNGLTRSRVPCPILRVLKARAGDYLFFRLGDQGEAILRVSRSRMKSGRGNRRKSASRKTTRRKGR